MWAMGQKMLIWAVEQSPGSLNHPPLVPLFLFHSHCGLLGVDDGVGGGNQHCLVFIGCLLVSFFTFPRDSDIANNTLGGYYSYYYYLRTSLLFIAN